MIVGIGLDVLEVARMERELARDPHGFPAQLFSPAEIAWCARQARPAGHFAARFAAKEAAFKALGLTGADVGAYREAEVTGAEHAPGLALHGRLERLARDQGVRHVRLALAGTREVAVAGVVLESSEGGDA